MANNIDFIVQEIRPDGTTINRKIDIDSLVSDQPATLNPSKISFTGKVTGDAAFSVTITSERGAIGVTGKILDPGTIKNPLRFFIQVTVPSPYKFDDKSSKAFEKKMKDDEVRLIFIDNKRLRLRLDSELDGFETYPDPIKSAELALTPYQGSRICYGVSDKSHLKLTNRGKALLSEGFQFEWSPNEGANPDAEKLIMEVR